LGPRGHPPSLPGGVLAGARDSPYAALIVKTGRLPHTMMVLRAQP
jgi:hypothetical protein